MEAGAADEKFLERQFPMPGDPDYIPRDNYGDIDITDNMPSVPEHPTYHQDPRTGAWMKDPDSTTQSYFCSMGMGCGRHLEMTVNDGEGLSYTGAAIIGNSYLDKIVWDTGSDQMV